MGWLDRYRPASFRGARFYVQEHSKAGGRRGPDNEFPQKDQGSSQDLGGVTPTFNVTAYVIGDDYDLLRDLLERALEQSGPGQLVVPTRAPEIVQVRQWTVHERLNDEGAYAEFSITFKRASRQKSPAVRRDTAAAVRKASEDGQEEEAANFEETFSLLEAAQHVIDSAKALIEDVTAAYESVASAVKGVVAQVESYQRQIAQIKADVQNLINQPALLAQRIMDLGRKLKGLFSVPDLFAKYRELLDFGSDRPPVSQATPQGVQQAKNEAAMLALVRISSAFLAGEALADMQFESIDQAEEFRDLLLSDIDALLETAPDDLFGRLQDLRATIAADIAARSANLSKIVEIPRENPRPLLVEAWDFHGDALRYEEIQARNNVPHPGFPPPAAALRFLTDAR
ncbi:MAG: DNA circularization N-terminal domain-containing protein [Bdellovibrionota bacterium]